jgi:hypothetical protein
MRVLVAGEQSYTGGFLLSFLRAFGLEIAFGLTAGYDLTPGH